MTTPFETPPDINAYNTDFTPAVPEAAPVALPLTPLTFDPDHPQWIGGSAIFGFFIAISVWLGSVALLFAMQLLAVIPYIVYRMRGADFAEVARTMATDPHVIFISIAATIPAHVATFALVWLVVTGAGKRPFRQVIGWSWSARMNPGVCFVLALALLFFGGVLTKFFGGGETQLDQIVSSSVASRFTVAFLATFTAPLVEESVYRGVLYPATLRAASQLMRRLLTTSSDANTALWKTRDGGAHDSSVTGKADQFGMALAIIFVSILFAGVHVAQYYNNLGVIVTVALLSFTLTLVRARTRRLLPCFAIHFIFNGLQSLYIVLEPYLKSAVTAPTQQQGALVSFIAHALGFHL